MLPREGAPRTSEGNSAGNSDPRGIQCLGLLRAEDGGGGRTDGRTDRWMVTPAPRPASPVEADELPVGGFHGQLVLSAHSLVLVAEEPMPRGAVALGDGGDVELLRGHFSEGP